MASYTPDALEERDGALFLRIRVIPGAGRTSVGGSRHGALLVRVAEAPEKGRANQAVIEAVAAALALPRRAIEIDSGERGREKRLRIGAIGREELSARLAPLLAPAEGSPGSEE